MDTPNFKDVVLDKLVTCHIYRKEHDDNPVKAVNDLIAWEVDVALDPLVSQRASDLIADNHRLLCARLREMHREMDELTAKNKELEMMVKTCIIMNT